MAVDASLMAIDVQPTEPFPASASPDFAASGAPPMPAPPTPLEAESFGLAPPPDGFRPIREDRSPARTPLLVGGVVCAALLVIAAVTLVLHRGDGFPEAIGGLPRLHSAVATQFESTLASTQIGGVHMRGAMYGNGVLPQLIVERFDGVPDTYLQGSASDFFDQAARGFETTSGTTVDTADMVSQTIDAVVYQCASVHPSTTSTSSFNGALCMWKGADLGLLVTIRTNDPAAAIADVRSTYTALH